MDSEFPIPSQPHARWGALLYSRRMATPVELIKEKLDVATVVRGYIELMPAGRNFKARCPFHGEKTPSFVVTPDRGSWKCFGCGKGGDIFSFVQEYEHVEFPDALRLLAEKAGVELRRVSPEEERFTGVLYRANAAAAAFFASQVSQDVPAAYLGTRGISPEAAAFFEIGWAAPDQSRLVQHLRKEGFSADDLVRAGLAVSTEYGLRDRFRARLMFPIWSALGKPVAFTGRIHPEHDTGNLGKYVNSPETPIFSKGKVLYGYGKTKEAIRQAGRAVLVEGQVDAVACWQAGVRNVVALSGTAFTRDHVALIARSAKALDLAFDADDAGWAAAEKAAHLALSAGLEVRVVRWPAGKDAADLALEDPAAVLRAVEEAVPVVEAWVDRLIAAGTDFRSGENVAVLRRILALVNAMGSAVQRAEWMRYLSRKTGLPEGVLMEEAGSVRAEERLQPYQRASQPQRQAPPSRWEALVEQALAAAYHERALADVQSHLLPERAQAALMALREEKAASEDPAIDALIQRVVTGASYVLGSGSLRRLLGELEACFLAEERARLSGVVADAERAGDQEALREALAALAALPRP